jgi:hypothetical protein
MPSTSVAQRRLFGLAEHHPEKLHKANRSLANLPRQTLHDFATTSESGLPARRNYGEDGGRGKDDPIIQTGTDGKYLGDGWVSDVTSQSGFKKGALTAQANRAGMTPMAFARKHYHDSGTTGSRARFAVNAQK